jgi:hypothetical protein
MGAKTLLVDVDSARRVRASQIRDGSQAKQLAASRIAAAT